MPLASMSVGRTGKLVLDSPSSDCSLAPAGPARHTQDTGSQKMSKRSLWTIFILGNATIAVAAWLTAPLVLGERPPFWIWAIVATGIIAFDAVLAIRRRRAIA
jgi:hypothetical protein